MKLGDTGLGEKEMELVRQKALRLMEESIAGEIAAIPLGPAGALIFAAGMAAAFSKMDLQEVIELFTHYYIEAAIVDARATISDVSELTPNPVPESQEKAN